MADPTPNPASLASAASSTDAAKWAAALQRAGERQKRFLRLLIPTFLSEYPELMNAIRQAIADQDVPRLKFAARTLKSSLLFLAENVGAGPLQQLEVKGRSGNLAGGEEAYSALEKTLATLLPVLVDFVGEPTSP